MEMEFKDTHHLMISEDDDHVLYEPKKAEPRFFKSRRNFNGFIFLVFTLLMAILWISLSYVRRSLFEAPSNTSQVSSIEIVFNS